jgi:hypothetical protein
VKNYLQFNLHDHPSTEIFQHLLASATLVDFPQFRDIHHLIPQVLDLRPKHTTERDYHQIEDSDKWEIYVKYRKIVSRFLIDLKYWSLCVDPQLRIRYPQEDWNTLYSNTHTACRLAAKGDDAWMLVPSITKRDWDVIKAKRS